MVGPLWTGMMSAWFSLASLTHSLIFLFGLGTSTKLLHYSGVLSTPRDTKICCFYSQSNSSLNCYCNMHTTHLGGPYMVRPIFDLQWECSFKTANACEPILELIVYWLCYYNTCFHIYFHFWPWSTVFYAYISFYYWPLDYHLHFCLYSICTLLFNLWRVSSGFYCVAFHT